MKVTVRNCDWVKGSLYFRKRISHKYLVNGKKKVEIKKALRPITKKYYHILVNNHQELAKLSSYLNHRIDIFLQHKGKVEMIDIIEYIHNLCDEYYKQAIVENSSLEIKRVEELEYINENGIQQGYSIQALAKEYKIITIQYDNLDNQQRTVELGSTIVKRSNITKEQLLDIAPNQLTSFYEMLIKAEKAVLENDIKLYISRNLYQFSTLVTDLSQDQTSKIEEAFYSLLKIIRDNDPQIDYPSTSIPNQKEIETRIAKVIDELKEFKTTAQLRRHQYQDNKLYETKEKIMRFTLIPETKAQFTSLLTDLIRYSGIKDEKLSGYFKEFVCISIQALNTSKDFFALKGLIYEAFLDIWRLIATYNLQQSLIATKKYTEKSLDPYLNFNYDTIHQQLAEIYSFVPKQKEIEKEYRKFIGISKNKKPLSEKERKKIFEEFEKTDTSDIFRKLNLH